MSLERGHPPSTLAPGDLGTQMAQASVNGVLAFDLDLRITFWNQAMERLSGFPEAEVLGRPVFEALPFLRGTAEEENVRKVLTGTPVEPNGRSFPVPGTGYYEAHYVPLFGGGAVAGGFAIVRDLTDTKHAQAELRESEARFGTMADSAPVLLWMAGTDAECTFFNQVWLDFTGRPLDREVGTGWAEGVHPEDFQRCMHTYMDAFVARRPFRMEYRLRRADGAYRWVLDQGVPRYAPGGEFAGFIGSCVDITELKEAEETLSRLNEELEARVRERTQELRENEAKLTKAQEIARLGHWEWDVRENQITWSDELHRIYGIDPGEFAATFEAYLERVHPEDRDLARRTIETALRERQSFTFEERILRSDGEVRHLYSWGNVALDEGGQVIRMFGVCQDITERKRAEEELAARAAELARSNADLEQFAYVASHDLQEPLRAISGYVQLLSERYRGKLDPDADEFISFILGGTRRMRDLIRDLLAYSRAGRAGGGVQRVETRAVVDQVLADLGASIEESGAKIACDDLPAVAADPTQLKQLFQNLISNAIKFRGAAAPEVRVAVRRDGAEWQFSVRDNGIGIDPRFRDRVFGIFQRLHTTSEYPGTGIGLAVCKKIVERHGGRIWVEETSGGGTDFRFTWPAI